MSFGLLCTPPHHVSPGPQPGPKKADKKPVYVINITIPPIFVDNHVEPSKSAVNIQVGPPLPPRFSRKLTIEPRITRFYTPSFRASSKSFWSEIRLPNRLLRFSTTINPLKTLENDEDSQTTRFPFIHQGHPNDHTLPQRLTAALQNMNFYSRVAPNVQALVTGAVLVVTNARTPRKGTDMILVPLAFITVMSNRIWEDHR